MASILLPFGATKASRIVIPSFVLIGIFCKFGSDDESLPVEVTACWYEVCTRDLTSQISESLSVYVLLSFARERYSRISLTIS